jgi:hypothetical protein
MTSNRRNLVPDVLRPACVLAAALLLAALPACSKRPSNEGVLVRVGTNAITVDDFRREVEWRRTTGRPVPGKQALLDEMIGRELRLQKARAAGLESDPDVRRTFDEVLVSKLEERELTPQIDGLKITPEEVRAAYEKELPHYTRPAKAHLAFICIKADRTMTTNRLADLEARITEARTQALALPPGTFGFGRVAVDYSEDQTSRYRGGDAGWFDEGVFTGYRWPEAAISAGFALKNPGEISEVIKTPAGFYLAMKLDTRPSVVTPLEQVRASLERRLLAAKQEEARDAFARALHAVAPVQTFPEALAALDFPTTTVAKAREPSFSNPPGAP